MNICAIRLIICNIFCKFILKNTLEIMEKPSITIDLKKHLHDFLLHEFKTDEHGAIILHRRSDVGLFIDSMWDVSKQPKEARLMEHPVRIIIPVSEENHYILQNNFIHVPVWKESQINKYLEAEFRRRVRDFFAIGYEKKFKQIDIIESFLSQYGMKNNAINFDQIKKLDYRNRETLKKTISKEIQSAVCQ
jgi:hypothetical protein